MIAQKRVAVSILLLAVLVLAAFSPAFHAGFVSDDAQYILANNHVLGGLSADGVRWAFTSFYASNWHPLTWLSHMLDVSLFGTQPAGHHAMNVFLHAVNGSLLYLLLLSLTGKARPSLLAAVLFAIHPLRVESVAWVAERKDVLSALFFFLTLLAFAHYARRPKLPRYLAVCLLFALGLMAKPMLVTVPFVLLLLDYWPLNRFPMGAAGPRLPRVAALIREKIPLFCLAAASAVITYFVQKDLGATIPVKDASFGLRAANAVCSYFSYLMKTVWPAGLSPLYPFPDHGIPAAKLLLSAGILIAVTAAALRWAVRKPYFVMGWFWFLGMLVPVIGLVQAGEQAMADRYTYLPLIGILAGFTWGSEELSRVKPFAQSLVTTGWAIITVTLAFITFTQTGYWRDTRSLYEHTLKVTSGNYVALTALGCELARQGDQPAGERLLREGLDLNAGYVWAHYNLAVLLQGKGATNDALFHYRESVRLAPRFALAQASLGAFLAVSGQPEEALFHLREAVRLTPEAFTAWGNLGKLLWQVGSRDEAIAAVRRALEINPGYESARKALEMMASAAVPVTGHR